MWEKMPLKSYQRPWWAFAVQMPALNTTLKEDHHAEQKGFVIEGEPVLRSLTWVIYGPTLAMVAVTIMGLVAWGLEVRSQSTAIKLFVVCAMVLLPVLFWVIGGGIINKMVQRALEQQIQAGREHVELKLDLAAKMFQLNQELPIPFDQITSFKLVSDAGVYYEPNEEGSSMVNLVMKTKQGQIILLKKNLGTLRQKLQLINQLEASIKS